MLSGSYIEKKARVSYILYKYSIFASSLDIISAPNNQLGDVNFDSEVNVVDIVIMVNVILGPIDNHFSFLCFADMNADGQLNVQDIVILVNLILS